MRRTIRQLPALIGLTVFLLAILLLTTLTFLV